MHCWNLSMGEAQGADVCPPFLGGSWCDCNLGLVIFKLLKNIWNQVCQRWDLPCSCGLESHDTPQAFLSGGLICPGRCHHTLHVCFEALGVIPYRLDGFETVHTLCVAVGPKPILDKTWISANLLNVPESERVGVWTVRPPKYVSKLCKLLAIREFKISTWKVCNQRFLSETKADYS
jgi:hypothetical protein